MKRLTSLLIVLLVLDLVAIMITFAYTANRSGGEAGMLPFVVLPVIGLISMLLLVTACIFYRKGFSAGSPRRVIATVLLALLILAINLLEISPVLYLG